MICYSRRKNFILHTYEYTYINNIFIILLIKNSYTSKVYDKLNKLTYLTIKIFNVV